MAVWGKLPPWSTTKTLSAKTDLLVAPDPPIWEKCKRAWVKDDGIWKAVYGQMPWRDPNRIWFPFAEDYLDRFENSGIVFGNCRIDPNPPGPMLRFMYGGDWGYAPLVHPEQYHFDADFTMDLWNFVYYDWGHATRLITATSFNWGCGVGPVGSGTGGTLGFNSLGGGDSAIHLPVPEPGYPGFWQYAVTRKDGTIRAFLNGIKRFEYFDDSDLVCSDITVGVLGGYPYNSPWDVTPWGILHLHFIKGTALWVDDFTPVWPPGPPGYI